MIQLDMWARRPEAIRCYASMKKLSVLLLTVKLYR